MRQGVLAIAMIAGIFFLQERLFKHKESKSISM